MACQQLNLQLNLPQDYPGFICTVQQLSSNTLIPANTPGPDQIDTSINSINPILVSLECCSSHQNGLEGNILCMDKNQQTTSLYAQSISPSQHQHYQDNGQCV